ncbi:MAG: efflux RND transporter periplasmic adaptor subunit [Patescibacteria group bacterium]
MSKNSGNFFHKVVGRRRVPLKNLATVLTEGVDETPPQQNKESIETKPQEIGNTIKPKKKFPPIFNKNMFWFVAGVMSLVVFVFLGGKLILHNRNSSPPQQAPQEAPPPGISLSGRVVTSSSVVINPNVNGTVGRVYVKQGDRVKAGQKIADLTPDQEDKEKSGEALSEYLAAKKNVELAQETETTLQQQYLEAHKRFMEGAVARNLPPEDPTYIQQKTEMDTAEKDYKKQQALVSGLKATASKLWQEYEQGLLSVDSPAAGVIGEINLTQGEAIPKTAVIIETEEDTTLVFTINEEDFDKIQTGDPAEVSFEAYPGKVFNGKVRKIEGRELTITMDKYEEPFAVGMTATATIKE